VTEAQYNNGTIPDTIAQQVTQLAGGNPNLAAETSNSYTIGVTFTPTFISNLTGSLDYYNINIKGGISTYPAAVIMQTCLQTGDPLACSQIVRNPNNGGLNGPTQATGGYIVQTAVNIGQSLIRGVDAQLNYRLPMDRFGDLTFNLNGAYLLNNKSTPAPGISEYDCAGLYGFTCQTVNPDWRHVVRTTWTTPWNKLALSLNWRYIGKVSLDNNDSNPTLHFASFGQYNGFNAKIPAFNYVDISGSWGFKEDMELRFGVNNIGDKNPPLITSEITAGGDANTYSTYDQMGREAFIAVTMKF
jgi:outer membrane receptor protein involved in Fe transport